MSINLDSIAGTIRMSMIRIVGRETRSVEISKDTTVARVSSDLKLSMEKYVTVLNGVPCTSDREVKESDDLVFLEVFSGG
jgi:sulfur carrier protein ThiS